MYSLLTAEISFPGLGIDLNPPDGFPLFGLYIRFYSIIIVAGILLAMLYAFKVKDRYRLTSDNLLDAVIYGTPAAIIGARLYYVIFEWDSFFSFWDIFKIWNGGLAIYGAIIAVIITAFVYAKLSKISYLSLMDVGSLGFLIGQSLGRWGNFFNREAYGVKTDLLWRMDIKGYEYGVHPAFLYESLWNILGFVLLHFYSKSKLRREKGEIFALYMGWYGLGRAMIEGIRADSLMLGDTSIRVSQLLGALFFIASVVCFILLRRRAAWIRTQKEQEEYVPLYGGDLSLEDEDAQGGGAAENSPACDFCDENGAGKADNEAAPSEKDGGEELASPGTDPDNKSGEE